MLMKRPDKLKQAKVGFERFFFLACLDVISLNNRIFCFEYNFLSFSFKGLFKFRITMAKANVSKL
jgi:hypothetical protein